MLWKSNRLFFILLLFDAGPWSHGDLCVYPVSAVFSFKLSVSLQVNDLYIYCKYFLSLLHLYSRLGRINGWKYHHFHCSTLEQSWKFILGFVFIFSFLFYAAHLSDFSFAQLPSRLPPLLYDVINYLKSVEAKTRQWWLLII